ncbi:MAG: LptF/LptG family permease [Candidatus Sulfobium sp.]|jgi:lipopolysaccharide export system permease protein
MKTVQRLYLKDFFILLGILAAGMSAIFSLLDLTSNIDNFMHGKPSVIDLLSYAALNVPRYFLYLLPMSVLIGSLFTFSQAHKRGEITAIKAAGGRLRTLFYPFIIAAVLLSVAAFLVGEVVVPDFSGKAIELRNNIEGKTRRLSFTDGALWLKSKDGSPVKIDLYIPDRKIARGISIFVVGKNVLKEEIRADEAVWDGNTWILKNISEFDIGSGKIEKLPSLKYPDLESPDLFTEEIKTTDEMGFFELYRYIQRLRAAGFNNVKMAVDINSKISFPLINVFMMLLGISLSLRMGLGSGLFSAGLGLLISLLYWFSYTFALSLGYAGILYPLFSAWLIPFFFSLLSVYLFLQIPE